MKTARTLVLSSRPLSWVNTAFPFGLTYYLFVRELDALFVVGSLFFLIPYNVLMYGINDVFDYESDLRNPRKGGVEGALLPPQLHRLTLWSSGLLAIPFVIALVVWGSWQATVVLALSLFFLVAYSALSSLFARACVLWVWGGRRAECHGARSCPRGTHRVLIAKGTERAHLPRAMPAPGTRMRSSPTAEGVGSRSLANFWE